MLRRDVLKLIPAAGAVVAVLAPSSTQAGWKTPVANQTMKEFLDSKKKTNVYWSRVPGKFVKPSNGEEVTGIVFKGTVREWYETLTETMLSHVYSSYGNDENVFLIVNGDILTVLQACMSFHTNLNIRFDDYYSNDAADKDMPKYCVNVGTTGGRVKIYASKEVPRAQVIVGSTQSDALVIVNVLDLNIWE